MSTVTKEWTVELIKEIIGNLDKKTGLKGASLPVKHGPDWKYACCLVKASGRRCYDRNNLLPDLDEDQTISMMCADDVDDCNIGEHIRLWKHLPLTKKQYEENVKQLRWRFKKEALFEVNDDVLNMRHGFGRVIKTYPLSYSQLLLIQFENGITEVLDNEHVYKMDNGVLRLKNKRNLAG